MLDTSYAQLCKYPNVNKQFKLTLMKDIFYTLVEDKK